MMTAYGILCAVLATLCVGRRIRRRCLVVSDQERLCLAVETGLRVVGHAREAGDVAALAVVFHAAEVGIILVALLIRRPIEDAILRGRSLFADIGKDDPEALAADGGIGQDGMGVRPDLPPDRFHLTLLHMVDVADGEACDASDMGGLLAVAIEHHRH